MSDVTVAPQGAAPSPAPQPSEVAIDPTPNASPNPIGSQAPSAPTGDIKGSEYRTPSRREAIQAAFDRANNPPPKGERPAPKPAPKAAEAKPGHNQPPEETPKLDLKKRPTEAPPAQPVARGDRGRFAPRQQDANQQAAQQAGTQATTYKQLPSHVPYAEPPVRISERARRDWADTPESVRADAHRWQQEFAKAYSYYKGSHEAFKPIKQFHDMAQSHGTTLERALTNFVGMEQKLRQDVVGGLDTIVNNLNLRAPDGSRLGLRDIAYHILSQSPEQLQMVQQNNAQAAAAHQLGSLHQEIAGLKTHLQQMHTQAQFTYTRSAVDQFADSHPRFDELGDLIEQELKYGFPLDTAYARAALLRPATHAAQTRTTSAQTRPADRSIHGAPDVTASNAASRRPRETSPTPRAALQKAMSQLNGR